MTIRDNITAAVLDFPASVRLSRCDVCDGAILADGITPSIIIAVGPEYHEMDICQSCAARLQTCDACSHYRARPCDPGVEVGRCMLLPRDSRGRPPMVGADGTCQRWAQRAPYGVEDIERRVER